MRYRDNKFRISIYKAAALLMTAVILVHHFPEVVVKADTKIDELEQKIREAKEEKEQTQERIKANKAEIDTLSDTATSLKGALNDLNVELTDVSNNLEELEGAIVDKNAEIAQMELDLEEALQIENDQYEAMKIRIKYMYEDKNYDLMETLFGSANFSDFLNRSNYFESIAAYDRKKLEEFRHTREVVEEEKADLDELKALAEEEQDRVMKLVNKTSNSLNNYENEIAETEREMEENEAMLAEQQANITALQKELEEERRLRELANRSAWRDISQVSFAEDDRYLLANLIYCEAGNQPYEGQVAVGAVVINRVLSSVFPDTVVGVIYQNKQFSPVGSGRLALALARNDATAACYSAADAAMSGTTTVGNCLFFRTPIEGLTGIQIGGHIFY